MDAGDPGEFLGMEVNERGMYFEIRIKQITTEKHRTGIHGAGQRMAAVFHELHQCGASDHKVCRAAVCVADGGRFLPHEIQRALLQAALDRGDPDADRQRDLLRPLWATRDHGQYFPDAGFRLYHHLAV